MFSKCSVFFSASGPCFRPLAAAAGPYILNSPEFSRPRNAGVSSKLAPGKTMRAPTTPRASKRHGTVAAAAIAKAESAPLPSDSPSMVRKPSVGKPLPQVVWKKPVHKSHCSFEGVLGFISEHLFAVAMVVSFVLISWVVRNKGGLAVFEDFVMDLIACATGLAISHWHEFWAKRQQSSRRLRHERTL
jgi:hypothetical protein